MLAYLADLHRRSTRPAGPPFPYPWVEIGPGYHAPAFGHWDIVHATLDLVPTLPRHAERQILNNLANQEPDGLVPGVIWVERPNRPDEGPGWSTKAGHPPLWPIAPIRRRRRRYREPNRPRSRAGCGYCRDRRDCHS